MAKCRITTADNPFNPFTQVEEWLAYDRDKRYFTCEYLARIAKTSTDVSISLNEAEIERAIDEIISFNGADFYKKVYKNEQPANH